MVTIEKDDLSVRVKVNGDKMYYCLYDITKNLGIGSKGGNSIKEAIERAFKRKLSKSKIGKDDFSFIDDEQLEYFLRCYSTSAELNAFLREIPYRYKSYMAKQEIAKESQKPKVEVEVPSVVEKEIVSTNVVESQVQVFNCELGSIRVIIDNGEPFFMASDLCQALEYKNGRDTINRLFEPSVAKYYAGVETGKKADGSPAIQNKLCTFLTESQMYKLIMRSNAKNAEAFQDWICGEVIPSIRKTGSYQVVQKPAIPQTYAEALLEAGRLALENEKLQAQAIENAPKVVAYDKLMDTHNNISIKEFGKIIGMGEKNLFKWLRDNSYLMADNKPYQRYIDRGYFEVVEKTCNIDENRSKNYTQTLITPKGQGYLSNKIKS